MSMQTWRQQMSQRPLESITMFFTGISPKMSFISFCIDTKDEIIKDALTKFAGDVNLAGVPIL